MKGFKLDEKDEEALNKALSAFGKEYNKNAFGSVERIIFRIAFKAGCRWMLERFASRFLNDVFKGFRMKASEKNITIEDESVSFLIKEELKNE